MEIPDIQSELNRRCAEEVAIDRGFNVYRKAYGTRLFYQKLLSGGVFIGTNYVGVQGLYDAGRKGLSLAVTKTRKKSSSGGGNTDFTVSITSGMRKDSGSNAERKSYYYCIPLFNTEQDHRHMLCFIDTDKTQVTKNTALNPMYSNPIFEEQETSSSYDLSSTEAMNNDDSSPQHHHWDAQICFCSKHAPFHTSPTGAAWCPACKKSFAEIKMYMDNCYDDHRWHPDSDCSCAGGNACTFPLDGKDRCNYSTRNEIAAEKKYDKATDAVDQIVDYVCGSFMDGTMHVVGDNHVGLGGAHRIGTDPVNCYLCARLLNGNN